MERKREEKRCASVARVDVVEEGMQAQDGWLQCQIGRDIQFITERLETYCVTNWQPVVYDGLLLAAAVEFADRTQRRQVHRWGREIKIRVPAHDPDRWNARAVLIALTDALDFLTGDRWDIHFVERSTAIASPRQPRFELSAELTAVLPYSDGLDSYAVGCLLERELGSKLLRVRVGTKAPKPLGPGRHGHPFTSVPYRVRSATQRFVESSARSRGFKFALMGGLAAHLVNANNVIVSESGQGALGPVLVAVGQSYEDYRVHPLFTERMERLFAALLGGTIRFQFPRIWYTKGETLTQFVNECGRNAGWSSTRSCWQQNRHASVECRRRQCGICAACMLRRMSVHSAGMTEPEGAYIWQALSSETFRGGALAGFAEKKITGKMREYAIAGVLHLDHLAGLLASPANQNNLDLNVHQLSRSMTLPEAEVRTKLARLLAQHRTEWKEFVNSLGSSSFVADWAVHGSV